MAGPDGKKGVVGGAVFLMATSAIGPGFLTQTAVFTASLAADFAFAILLSMLVDVAVQANVWRVLGVARRRGPELASALLPGLGSGLTLLVALGGFAFNVGNVAGCGLGLAVFGVPAAVGSSLSAVLAFALLASPRAARGMDVCVKLLGAGMLLLTSVVMLGARPDYAAALAGAVWPGRVDVLAALTLIGGTVGGYITFAGAHRLIDAGVGGPEDVTPLTRAAVLGVLVTGAMRVLLFLAVLGVVGRAGVLDPGNPAASAFRLGAGEWGFRFFGLVLWSAAITSVVGCSYTTLSFVRSLGPAFARRQRALLAWFILGSLAVYLLHGRPVGLLVLAGALNGLILPASLGAVLLVARRADLMGRYRHPAGLLVAGWLAWLVTLVGGAWSLGDLRRLF